MSVSWLAFAESEFKISLKTCFLYTCKKRKMRILLHTSPIVSMLGPLLYFVMDLITG